MVGPVKQGEDALKGRWGDGDATDVQALGLGQFDRLVKVVGIEMH